MYDSTAPATVWISSDGVEIGFFDGIVSDDFPRRVMTRRGKQTEKALDDVPSAWEPV